MGDREHPRAELTVIALETVQIPDDLEEDIPGEILGIGRALAPQVSDDAGSQVLVYVRPRGFGARPGRLQHPDKVLPHTAIVPRARGPGTPDIVPLTHLEPCRVVAGCSP